MGKKKTEKSEITINFIGNNSTEVTGSMILIKTKNKKILLECGMTQSCGNPLDDYKINSQPFPFKPKDIDYVFLNHAHIDHQGLIPKLVKEGFKGQIITTKITYEIMKPMLLNSCEIIRNDARILSKIRKKEIKPYYDKDDVFNALDKTCTYDYNIEHNICENISFKFLRNSHVLGSSQLELYITNSKGIKKSILYTSDLGSFKVNNHYVDNNDKCNKVDIVITECTYGAKNKESSPNRKKDLEKLNLFIRETCIEKKGRIIIPVFAFSRSQEILTNLYEMYHKDSSFNIPIFVDSPLIMEVNKAYSRVLEGENLELFKKACSWKNVKFISSSEESNACVSDKSPKIVLSSSGFLTFGRSCNYLLEYISNPNDCIVSVGYSPETSTFGKIKNGEPYIKINKSNHKNECSCFTLNSFSSHIPRHELLSYMKSIYCDSVYLVHGDEKSKQEFKIDLQEEYSKMCRTTKVVATVKDMVARL